jgi:hypothetical protein
MVTIVTNWIPVQHYLTGSSGTQPNEMANHPPIILVG